MKPLGIEGAWVRTPEIHPDDRGVFLESFRNDEFAADLGYEFNLQQVSWSVSRWGVIRGIHFADVPPGQAKYVTCVRGAILDVIVDIRVGSPTFGKWQLVYLDERDKQSVFLAEGLGHAFQALAKDTTVVYLCSAGHNPAREHGINPLDPDLGITWDAYPWVLSEKDADAPSLAQALDAGLLPEYGVS